MEIQNVLQLYRLMSNQHFMMSYSGVISQQSVRSLLSIAEKKLDQAETDVAVRKKVFSVMVECLQSVYKGETAGSSSVFMLGKDDEQYSLYSCFYCTENHREKLCFFLDQLENWGTERLKEEHRHLLADVFNNNNSSAFFSLIDITLKSKSTISYDFCPGKDGRILFSMKTTIKHRTTA